MAGSIQFTTNRKPNTTNLSEARVGNASCWDSMKSLHMLHTALTGGAKASSEATVSLKSDLSTQYAGPQKQQETSTARMGSAGCWNTISQIAWEKAMTTRTSISSTDENKHCSDTLDACKDQTEAQRRLIQYNKLKTMAENCRVCKPGHTNTEDRQDTETLLSLEEGEDKTETVDFSEMPPSPKSLSSEVSSSSISSSSSSSSHSDEDSPPGGTTPSNNVLGWLGNVMPNIGTSSNSATTQTNNKEKAPLMDEQHLEMLKKNAMQAAGIVPQDKVVDEYNYVDGGKDQHETMGYCAKGRKPNTNKEEVVDPSLDLSNRIDDLEKEMGLVSSGDSSNKNKPFGAQEYNYWKAKRAPTELRMDSCFGDDDDDDDDVDDGDHNNVDTAAAPVNGQQRTSITMGRLNNIFGSQKKQEEKASKTTLSGSL